MNRPRWGKNNYVSTIILFEKYMHRSQESENKILKWNFEPQLPYIFQNIIINNQRNKFLIIFIYDSLYRANILTSGTPVYWTQTVK